MTRRFPFTAWLPAALAAAALAITAACGGSESDGGVGSGGTGVEPPSRTLGTVNGFGSVFIDGVRYDDSQVPALREDEPGHEVVADVQLGDSVEVDRTEAGVLTRLHVNATLTGVVSSIDAATGTLQVLGQSVYLNANPARGPVTLYSGYLGADKIREGDAIELHGLILRRPGSYIVQATRVQHLAAVPKYLKASGLVSEVQNGRFTLAGLQIDATAATTLPAGGAVSNGKVASVMLPAASLVAQAGHLQAHATQVRIRTPGDMGAEVVMSGALSNLNTAKLHFCLGGYQVNFGGLSGGPGHPPLVEGSYVRVRGRVLPDGNVQALEVTLRNGMNEPEAELKGNVSKYSYTAHTFDVRGVTVDASQARYDGCKPSMDAGQYVWVTGALNATGVTAAQVVCYAEPNDATVTREGAVGAVDLAANCLVLTLADGRTVTVRWSSSTYFSSRPADQLAGHRVQVEGVISGGVLVAQKIGSED